MSIGLSPRFRSFGDVGPKLQRFPGQPGLPKLTELGLNRFPNAWVQARVAPPRGRSEQG